MTRTGLATVALCLLPALRLAAQDTPPAEAAAAKAAPRAPEASRGRRDRFVPLRVQITIGRLEGEKKVANLPFTLLVNAGDGGSGGRVSLRMGIEMPVRVATTGAPDKDGKSASVTSYQYKNVGTNIDLRAEALDEGRFNLDVRVEQSSLGTAADKLTPFAADLPLFRTVNASFFALLRDGQTATHVVATDPVNGETVRIEVGLTVVR
jgi:hypothetical protein